MPRCLTNSARPSARGASLALTLALAVACQEYNLQAEGNPEGLGADEDDTNANAGPQPEITVDPLTVDFGYLPKDCEADPQTVTVTNDGDALLEVTSIVLESADDVFSLAAAPQTLEPAESFIFEVGFLPDTWEEFTGVVQVTSNDADEALVAVDALGVGAEDATLEEVFEQTLPSAVDVLWVVDNSGSMSQEVERLQDSFDVFIQSFLKMGLDYQIGVVTTDMDSPTQSGKLVGSTPIIDMGMADPVGTFLANTNLGSGGSADERGLDASYAALTEPLISGANAGLVRPDANLAVIILSDEDDSSDITEANYSKWMEATKGFADKASLSAVVGAPATSIFDPGGCTNMTNNTSATAGTTYVNVAATTGGIWGDICDLDFNLVVQYLAYAAAGLKTDFVLSETPSNIGRIRVEVDGVTVDYHGVYGWTWEAADNAVQFHGDSVPGPGATVEISYPVKTECE
jgi:hypothetical protein